MGSLGGIVEPELVVVLRACHGHAREEALGPADFGWAGWELRCLNGRDADAEWGKRRESYISLREKVGPGSTGQHMRRLPLPTARCMPCLEDWRSCAWPGGRRKRCDQGKVPE